MFGQLVRRFIHTTSINLTNTVTKSPLAVLRKRTGFSFVNCKKALQLFDNDVDKAEEWLHSQAQKEGWEKVEKLKERATKQGLVAACKSEKAAAMVEINCETDFVARSSHFKTLVADVISVCRQHAENEVTSKPITKWNLSSSELALLPYQDGKTVADLLAMSVGKIGENINLRRALCVKVKDGLNLAVYAHPSSGAYDENASHIGNYSAMVLYHSMPNTAEVTQNISLTELGRQLCQHVIGMKPKTLGSMEDLKEELESSHEEEEISDETSENKLKKDEEIETSSESDSEDESTSSSDEEEDTETRLVHQKLLTDPETIVGHRLRQASIEVIDFARFERGEDISQLTEVK